MRYREQLDAHMESMPAFEHKSFGALRIALNQE